MKTAVCFFGEIRGTKEHWETIYNTVVKPNNADVFMSFTIYDPSFLNNYSNEERQTLEYYHKAKGLNYYPNNELFNIFKPLKMECNPKYSYSLETYNKITNKVNHVYSNTVSENKIDECRTLSYHNIMNQHETRQSAIKLKYDYEMRMKMQYDNVILTRLDINPMTNIVFAEKLTDMNVRGQPTFINEQLIAGPSSLMNVFLTLLSDMNEIYEKHCDFENHWMRNEYHIAKFFEKHKIIVKCIDIPLGYHIQHSNGLKRFNF
jgi:hypothetical protein